MPPPGKHPGLAILIGHGGPSPHEQDGGDDGLLACADDLIAAVHAKDTEGVASALEAAFELLDSDEDYEDGEEGEPDEGGE